MAKKERPNTTSKTVKHPGNETESHYRTIFEQSPDGILIVDTRGNIIEFNEAACRHLGYSREEFSKLSISDIDSDQTTEEIGETIKRILRDGSAEFEVRQRTKEGEIRNVLVVTKRINLSGRTVFNSVWKDITDQRRAEEDLRKLNRTLLALNNSSHALIRAKDEDWYLNEVCRIFVEDCGHAMVWIGYAEQDQEKTVRPVAYCGFDESYIKSLNVTWADTERGRGPVGTAIRTGKPTVFRNMLSDPRFAPWREEALKRGYAAAVGVPLLEDGRVFGSINIYSRTPNPFSDEEVKLLARLADDLAYGINSIRLRMAHAKADFALRESEEKFRCLFESSRDALMTLEPPSWAFTSANPATVAMFRAKNAEDVISRAPWQLSPKQQPDGRSSDEEAEEMIEMAMREGSHSFEWTHKRIDGEEFPATVLLTRMELEGRQFLQATIRDITEQKKAEDALKSSRAELYDNYFIQATINMILSESLENISLEEILQKALHMLLAVPWIAFESSGSISLVEDEADVLVMKAKSNLPKAIEKLCARVPFGKCLCGKAAQSQKIEFANHIDVPHDICCEGMQPHGHYSVPILFSGRTLGVLNVYLKGHIIGKKEEDFLRTVANTLAEIIIRKKAEERIEYLAYYDALTGLPNRNLFIDRLKQGVARAEPASKIVAVIIMDIDRFKSINDAYGTEVGDSVLNDVAGRLSTAVRKGDTVARLGNNEFGIALVDVAILDDVIPVIEKIMKYISHPLKIDGNEIALTFSTGISIYPQDSNKPLDLIKSAGLALGLAKKEGRKPYQFYTEDLNVKASEFLLMEKNLYNAIQNEEFLLYYQPYWDINTQKMVGMEALIRWQSKDMGLVSPGKFIPVLEESGMIIEVGEWILRTAVGQVKEWQNNGYPVVPVSVNLSLIQFRQKELIEMVKKVIGEFGFDTSLLTLEITESAFMRDIGFTSSVLKKLVDIGISISIDDFGTGYSSLSYLKRFPVDNLKIDISFIREIAADPDAASIVTAIISMAHTLGIKTIAEGVETEEQWKILRLLRCDMGQGFHLSKPLPAQEVEKYFKRQ